MKDEEYIKIITNSEAFLKVPILPYMVNYHRKYGNDLSISVNWVDQLEFCVYTSGFGTLQLVRWVSNESSVLFKVVG